MISSDVVNAIIKLKFGAADRAINMLPGDLRMKVTELRMDVFSCLKDELSRYMENGKRDKVEEGKGGTMLKKIELE